MASVRWSSTLERVLIEDVRADGTFLRVTVHQDSQVVVFSHWNGDVCVAATRIPMASVPGLLALLQDATAAPPSETD